MRAIVNLLAQIEDRVPHHSQVVRSQANSTLLYTLLTSAQRSLGQVCICMQISHVYTCTQQLQ